MKLTNPTDAQLNEAFAEKICLWYHIEDSSYCYQSKPDHWVDAKWPPPDFVNSADAVLPWLNQMRDRYEVSIVLRKQEPIVWVSIGVFGVIGSGEAETVERAAVIALLRAHGVEVVL